MSLVRHDTAIACYIALIACCTPCYAASSCVYALGDSLTAAYTLKLSQALPHLQIVDGGLGGQGSTSIAARAGALPVDVSVDGNVLPAVGSVPIKRTTPEILAFSGTETAQAGQLAGVEGMLIWNRVTGYRFQRATAGSPASISDPSRFVVDRSMFKDCILILWAGRNGYQHPDVVLKDIEAIVGLWKARQMAFYVLSIPNGAGEGQGTRSYDQIDKINRQLRDAYGSSYIDVRSALIEHGPRAADMSQADTVPSSLRSDSIHLNNAGIEIVIRELRNRISEP